MDLDSNVPWSGFLIQNNSWIHAARLVRIDPNQNPNWLKLHTQQEDLESDFLVFYLFHDDSLVGITK